jgi:hypothetical protein
MIVVFCTALPRFFLVAFFARDLSILPQNELKKAHGQICGGEEA